MRAKRLQALLATGWVKGSGSSSAKVRIYLSDSLSPTNAILTPGLLLVAGGHERRYDFA